MKDVPFHAALKEGRRLQPVALLCPCHKACVCSPRGPNSGWGMVLRSKS